MPTEGYLQSDDRRLTFAIVLTISASVVIFFSMVFLFSFCMTATDNLTDTKIAEVQVEGCTKIQGDVEAVNCIDRVR